MYQARTGFGDPAEFSDNPNMLMIPYYFLSGYFPQAIYRKKQVYRPWTIFTMFPVFFNQKTFYSFLAKFHS